MRHKQVEQKLNESLQSISYSFARRQSTLRGSLGGDHDSTGMASTVNASVNKTKEPSANAKLLSVLAGKKKRINNCSIDKSLSML